MQKMKWNRKPCRLAAVPTLAAAAAFILSCMPQTQALASNGAGLPFNDPIWKALVGLALLVNGFLYFLVWRRRSY